MSLPTDIPSSELQLTNLNAEEKQWGMLCHLASYLGLLVGGFTFIGPLACWLIKKDTSRFVDYHGKESLNFHLNILIYVLITIPIGLATCGFGFILTGLVALYGLIMPAIAATRASNGELYLYPLTIRMIK